MPDRRHTMEAEKLLAQMGITLADTRSLPQRRRLLAEALERAERRGRGTMMSGSEKESSG
ncbi:hypothetical protein [Microvirga roseola]|uniref:hypothetical protein n=1 Tax=Microvirga roseola TaxID=2883126 RepID=UPI001E55287F|nr:hypothetical protein [Microvirga roseola]